MFDKLFIGVGNLVLFIVAVEMLKTILNSLF